MSIDISKHPWVIMQKQLEEHDPEEKEREARRHMEFLIKASEQNPTGRQKFESKLARKPLQEITSNIPTHRHPPLLIDRKPSPPLQVKRGPFPPQVAELRLRAQATAMEQQAQDLRAAADGASSRKNGVKTHVGPWELGKTLGKGSTCRVRKARHRLTKELAAVKILPKELALRSDYGSLQNLNVVDAQARKQHSMLMPLTIEREVAILKLIDHPSITRLYDVWENRSEIYIVMEYVGDGDLFDYIRDFGPLEERTSIFIFRQIMAGMEYLHSMNVCHRDLKCENVLVTNGGVVKIADFSMAAIQQGPNDLLQSYCGSPHYCSPEIVGQRGPYIGAKCDVWSMGVVLYAMLSNTLPFDAGDLTSLLATIVRGVYKIPPTFSPEAVEFINKLLVLDPSRRLSVREMWSQPLIRKWDKIDLFRNSDMQVPNRRKGVDYGPVSPDEIDPEILRQLQIMWHRVEEGCLKKLLTNRNKNDQKLFYWLLYDYRERILEDLDLHLPHSQSDYHHVRPGVTSHRVQRTCDFDGEDGKGKSRFTVITQEAAGQKEGSYDPYRATSMPVLKSPAVSRARITVHRHNQRNKAGDHPSSPPSVPRSVTGSIIAPQRTAAARSSHRNTHIRPQSPLSPRIGTHGRYYSRPVHRPKRSVNFARVRSHQNDKGGSMTSASASASASDQKTNQDNCALEKAREKALRAAADTAAAKKKAYDDEEMRKFSSSIAHTLDEAFKSTIVPSPSSSPPVAFGGGQVSLDIGPPLDMSTPQGRRHVKSWDSRPLPPAPPKSESVVLEMLEARENAEIRRMSGTTTESRHHVNKVVSHLNKLMQPVLRFKNSERVRIASAPESPPKRSPRSVFNNDADPRVASVASAPLQKTHLHSSSVMDTPAEHYEHRGLSYLAKAERTIRVVNSPSHRSPGPVQVPAPPNIKSRQVRGHVTSTNHVQDHPLNIREAYTRQDHEKSKVGGMHNQHGPDGSRGGLSQSSANSGKLNGKRSWFRRSGENSNHDDVLLVPGTAPPIAETTESGGWEIYTNGTGPFSANPTIPPPQAVKKSSLFPFWKKEGKEKQPHMTIAGPDVHETPTPRPPHMRIGQYGSEFDNSEGPMRQIQVEQNWLARLFHFKPATSYLCFEISRRRARQEISSLLRDWRKYGIRDIEVDKSRHIVFARVGAKNYLGYKEVSFAAEVSMVIEHGKKRNTLSIAKFTQERGAASSFHKVVDTMDTVFGCRNLLVTNKTKRKMMIKTLNSPPSSTTPSAAPVAKQGAVSQLGAVSHARQHDRGSCDQGRPC